MYCDSVHTCVDLYFWEGCPAFIAINCMGEVNVQVLCVSVLYGVANSEELDSCCLGIKHNTMHLWEVGIRYALLLCTDVVFKSFLVENFFCDYSCVG